MSKLISGKEALIALAHGEEVEYFSEIDDMWLDMLFKHPVLKCILKGDHKFRLKPKTITLNGIEVPAPFEPKDGEKYYYISFEFKYGYSSWSELGCHLGGAWRTEAEIKQVVAALRSIFKGE